MCETCFTEERKLFKDLEDWKKFDFELSKKLVAEQLKYINFDNDGKNDKDDGVYRYDCLTCMQIWYLREPNDSWGGGSFMRG